MKTNQCLMLLALSLITASFAPSAFAGNDTQNGGGGVRVGGRYMTFYSAGLYAEPVAKTKEDLRSLNYLMRFVEWMPFLSTGPKTALLDAIVPSPTHEYFKVDESHFDPATLERLKAEFQRVTKVAAGDTVLYALTDTSKRQTFLLPDFFKLENPKDQAAILFHEAYWLLKPNATYDQVVAIEMAFQAVTEKPTDRLRIAEFLKYYSGRGDELKFAVESDLATGALAGLLNAQNQISYKALFGERAVKCISWGHGVLDSVIEGCRPFANVHLAKLTDQYPESAFLKLVHRNLGRFEADYTRWYGRPTSGHWFLMESPDNVWMTLSTRRGAHCPEDAVFYLEMQGVQDGKLYLDSSGGAN